MEGESTTYETTTVADVTDTVIRAGDYTYDAIEPWYGPTYADYGQSYRFRLYTSKHER